MTTPARALRLSLVPVLALGLAACGGGSKHSSQATTTDPTTGCIPWASAPPAKARQEPKPTTELSPSKTYDVTFLTNCGSFTIRLAVKTSPNTAASFFSLAQKGFFDHTIFPRIIPGFVIQGGDPTASGTGGPGYTTVDPPPASTQYTLGSAAMAKTASQPSGTAGSQFFVVTPGERRAAPRIRGARQGRARPAGRPADRQAGRSRVGQRGHPDGGRRDREGDRPRRLARSSSRRAPRRATAASNSASSSLRCSPRWRRRASRRSSSSKEHTPSTPPGRASSPARTGPSAPSLTCGAACRPSAPRSNGR